jgi:hypothetical protein
VRLIRQKVRNALRRQITAMPRSCVTLRDAAPCSSHIELHPSLYRSSFHPVCSNSVRISSWLPYPHWSIFYMRWGIRLLSYVWAWLHGSNGLLIVDLRVSRVLFGQSSQICGWQMQLLRENRIWNYMKSHRNMVRSSPLFISYTHWPRLVSGELARIGPRILLTSDPDLLQRMSSARSAYTKSDWYAGQKLEVDHDNLFSTLDDKTHTKRRAQMAIGVSKT